MMDESPIRMRRSGTCKINQAWLHCHDYTNLYLLRCPWIALSRGNFRRTIFGLAMVCARAYCSCGRVLYQSCINATTRSNQTMDSSDMTTTKAENKCSVNAIDPGTTIETSTVQPAVQTKNLLWTISSLSGILDKLYSSVIRWEVPRWRRDIESVSWLAPVLWF